MEAERATSDDEQLEAFASRLADEVDAAIGPWVRRCVSLRAGEAGRRIDPALERAADEAAELCAAQVGPSVRDLLRTDIDDQQTTPLALVRGTAVRYPTEVLHRAGVAPVRRDEFDRRSFPGDDYDLTPATFADLGESVGEAAMMWGAAKAHVHLARRRAQGSR